MINFNDVMTIINSVGFPVAMVLYFIWDKTKITSGMTEAINNNTTILTRLLERMDKPDLLDK